MFCFFQQKSRSLSEENEDVEKRQDRKSNEEENENIGILGKFRLSDHRESNGPIGPSSSESVLFDIVDRLPKEKKLLQKSDTDNLSEKTFSITEFAQNKHQRQQKEHVRNHRRRQVEKLTLQPMVKGYPSVFDFFLHSRDNTESKNSAAEMPNAYEKNPVSVIERNIHFFQS